MLRFKTTLIFFVFALALLLALDILLLTVNFLYYAGIILVFTLIVFWGVKNIGSGFFIKAVCHGDRNERSVALTFDDGPDGQITPKILDILKENKVKAAFFVVGSKAEHHPEIIKRIDSEGHLLGGHSYSHHFFFDLFSTKRMIREMKGTEQLVFSLTGKKLHLFRPPYGVTNPTVAKAIRAMKYITVGWSLKSHDTVVHDELLLLNNLTTRVNRGDIILLHDNRTLNVKVLGLFIQYLKDKEFSISRLDDLINCKVYV